MKELIDQLESSLQSNNYYLSLFTALTIPDIAGAMESDDGLATGKKYEDWYNKWARPKNGEAVYDLLANDFPMLKREGRDEYLGREGVLTGQACYNFRCALLHQGRMMREGTSWKDTKYLVTGAGESLASSQHTYLKEVSRIYFVEPNTTTNRIIDDLHPDAVFIDLEVFCTQIIYGFRDWFPKAQQTENYKKNIKKFVSRINMIYMDSFAINVIG